MVFEAIISFFRDGDQGSETERRAAVADLFPACSVNFAALGRMAVLPRQGLLYNRIQKNANSSLITLFHYIETGRKRSPRRARADTLHLDGWPLHRMSELGGRRLLLVIRNPYSRVLSAFLNKMSKAHIREAYGEYDLTPAGFGRFLRWLDAGGLSENDHWNLQTRQILLPLADYTHVIRLENLGAELDAFLSDIGEAPERLRAEGAFSLGSANRTGARDKTAAFYDADGVAIVRRLFCEDFDILGYDPREMP